MSNTTDPSKLPQNVAYVALKAYTVAKTRASLLPN